MSRGADAVTRWRRNTKARIVASMGGSCVVCGYSHCLRALAPHHLNAETKGFSVSNGKNNRSWKHIVKELRKCVLLCANCHAEVHAGITEIPETAVRFDEEYSDYRTRQADVDQCPVCFAPKSDTRRYCSRACAAASKKRINWEQHDVSITELRSCGWSYEQIGDSMDVSGGAVWKRLQKLYG